MTLGRLPLSQTLALALTMASAGAAQAQPLILTNHLGYDPAGPKRAVIQGHPGDDPRACRLLADDSDAGATGDTIGGNTTRSAAAGGATAAPARTLTPQAVGPVAKWRDWTYWTLDFSDTRGEGTYRLACDTAKGAVQSFPFHIQTNILERRTLSSVIYYFKGQRASGLLDAADRALPLEDRTDTKRVDARGGWYDASGDYGKHLSHLSFSTYFNPQQLSFTAWGLLETLDLLQQRADPSFRQYLRRLADEGAWGADYLVRVKVEGGSFYRSVTGPGPGKRPEDRRIGRDASGFAIKQKQTDTFAKNAGVAQDEREYQSSLRAGGGVAIAALARAASMKIQGDRSADYLRTAEEAWSYLAAHNADLLNDGVENIVDDYCALLAAVELYRATSKPAYRTAADTRARQLVARLAPAPQGYWRAAAGTNDRPFFHAADAGLPVVSLLAYADIADAATKATVLAAVRRSLEWELATTANVANPFGYARQLVQTKTGVRDTRFFYPHDAETAPWWQGEDARIASLAFAARRALPFFTADPAFSARLSRYAQDQLNWILGLNPFDASLLQGSGRNNPEYRFFDSYEYTNAPGGIVNGVTAGYTDPQGIDFNLPQSVTKADHDWRWAEQWLPHGTWYLLAVAAGSTPQAAQASQPATVGSGSIGGGGGGAGRAEKPAIIAYVFPRDRVIDPAEIAVDKLTHINYAFADVKDGRVVEGFAKDAENFKVLTELRRKHPHLRILISVGGWTWSGNFSDAALTADSRRRFVSSAIAFVRRHDIDGVDIDWEYPGLRGNGNVNRPEDKQNFTLLMVDLRRALDEEGKARGGRHYFLTFAAGGFPDFIAHSEMDKVQASVDFVNLMTYDFREAEGEPTAGHHSNLYAQPLDTKQLSTDRAVRDFMAAGVPAKKIVVGVPFYGRAWGDVKGDGTGLYQPGGKVSERIETNYGRLSTTLVDRNGFVRMWDKQAQAPYLWNAEKKIFIAYDDPESLRLKSRYILDKGLGGVMFWEYYSDRTGVLLDTLFTTLHQAPAAPAKP